MHGARQAANIGLNSCGRYNKSMSVYIGGASSSSNAKVSFDYPIQREKALKKYPRKWKINLIERQNPDREDLYPSLL